LQTVRTYFVQFETGSMLHTEAETDQWNKPHLKLIRHCSKKGSVHARRRQRIEEERQRQDQSLTYQDGQDRFELVVSKKGSNGKKSDPRNDAPL